MIKNNLVKKLNFFIFIIVTLIIYSIFIEVYYQKYRQNAIEQALFSAQDFLRNEKAAKMYFNKDQKEKIFNLEEKENQEATTFLPALYSCTYASRKINEYYNTLRENDGLEPIFLHFISDNPKNRNNLANAQQKELLEKFRSEQIESFYKIYKNDYGQNILYYAHAGTKIKQECLMCHGNPQEAPKTLLKKYGNNGFDNKIGDIRSFTEVLMPLDGFLQKEDALFQTRAVASFIILLVIFFITFLFLKKDAKEAKKLQSIIDSLNDLVVIKSNDKILSANSAFLKFFNVENIKEFIAKNHRLCNHFVKDGASLKLDLTHIDAETIESLNAVDKTNRIVSMKNAQSELRNFTIKIYALHEDEFVIVLSDITKIKHRADLLEKKANIDTLTKVTSRQKFEELYHLELQRSQRYINSLSLLFFDIDHFKNINDTYGHDTGDKALTAFANIIKTNIREYDIFARWGGEEFILMLPQTDLSAAFKIAEKLRKKVAEYNFGIMGQITCSIGISMLKKDDDEKSLLKRADNALYKAKNSGRNRSIIDF